MAPPRKTIDELPEQGAYEAGNYLIVQDSGVTKKMAASLIVDQVGTPLQSHLDDATDAHDASAISATPSGTGVDGPNVQAQLGQIVGLLPPFNEVQIGTDEPTDAAIELWYDSDEPAGPGSTPQMLPWTDARDYGATGDGVADDTTALQAAAVAAEAAANEVSLPSGTFKISAVLDYHTTADRLAGLRGRGKYRSVINQTATATKGLIIGGRGQTITGLSLVTVTPQMDAASIGLAIDYETIFTIVDDLYIDGFAHGLAADTNVQAIEFSNTYRDIRVAGWYFAAYKFGNSSGSLHQNLYASALLRTGVLRMFETTDFSGEFIRINLERSTVRDKVIHATTTHAVSFHGLHNEGISIIGQTSSALRGETFTPCFYRTSGVGPQSIRNWTIDTCHIGGYIVTNLTQTAGAATATLELMVDDFQQKTTGGHGIEVGDTIFVSSAAEADYNGAHPVTAVTATTVTFTISGSPASPATVAAGADCITLNLGSAFLNMVPLVCFEGNAGNVQVDDLYIRDMRVIAPTAAQRNTLFRLGQVKGQGGQLRIRNLRLGNQRSNHSHWLGPLGLAGYSRTSNVATLYFSRPHNLATNATVTVIGATDASFNATSSGTLTIVSEFAVSFAQTGADKTLTRDTAASAYLQHAAISNVARTGNVATITTAAAHAVKVGHQIAIACSDTTYNKTNALVLSTPTTTTLTCRIEQADSTSASATGTVMLMEVPLPIGNGVPLQSGTCVMDADWLDRWCMIFAPGLIAAAATGAASGNIGQTSTARDSVEAEIVTPNDALNYNVIMSGAGAWQVRAYNPTAAGITPAATVVMMRIRRH